MAVFGFYFGEKLQRQSKDISHWESFLNVKLLGLASYLLYSAVSLPLIPSLICVFSKIMNQFFYN